MYSRQTTGARQLTSDISTYPERGSGKSVENKEEAVAELLQRETQVCEAVIIREEGVLSRARALQAVPARGSPRCRAKRC